MRYDVIVGNDKGVINDADNCLREYLQEKELDDIITVHIDFEPLDIAGHPLDLETTQQPADDWVPLLDEAIPAITEWFGKFCLWISFRYPDKILLAIDMMKMTVTRFINDMYHDNAALDDYLDSI